MTGNAMRWSIARPQYSALTLCAAECSASIRRPRIGSGRRRRRKYCFVGQLRSSCRSKTITSQAGLDLAGNLKDEIFAHYRTSNS
jgi:hypothetical protein